MPRIAGLTLDKRLAFEGERFADASNSFTSPGFATVDLGLRYGFRLADVPLTLRARITNVLDKFAWSAQPSGIFFAPPRSYGLSLRGAVKYLGAQPSNAAIWPASARWKAGRDSQRAR